MCTFSVRQTGDLTLGSRGDTMPDEEGVFLFVRAYPGQS